MSTMKRQKRHWLTEIIKVANNKRNMASDEAEDINRIVITEAWINDLITHPYFSLNKNCI
jgi:uncharacterized protein with PhoU and TrkA domain